MDPSLPWTYPYNFAQSVAATHPYNGPSTIPATTQLVLQAAHQSTTVTTSGTPVPFVAAPNSQTNTYDTVYSPLYQPSPKPAHLNAVRSAQVVHQQHQQPALMVVQPQQANGSHHASNASPTYFKQQATAAAVPAPSAIAWPNDQQQLANGSFGILPHENMTTDQLSAAASSASSGSSPALSASGTSPYDVHQGYNTASRCVASPQLVAKTTTHQQHLQYYDNAIVYAGQEQQSSLQQPPAHQQPQQHHQLQPQLPYNCQADGGGSAPTTTVVVLNSSHNGYAHHQQRNQQQYQPSTNNGIVYGNRTPAPNGSAGNVPAAASNAAPTTYEQKLSQLKITGPTAGFLNSYLKFLQGGRESSPPLRSNPRKSLPRNSNARATAAATATVTMVANETSAIGADETTNGCSVPKKRAAAERPKKTGKKARNNAAPVTAVGDPTVAVVDAQTPATSAAPNTAVVLEQHQADIVPMQSQQPAVAAPPAHQVQQIVQHPYATHQLVQAPQQQQQPQLHQAENLIHVQQSHLSLQQQVQHLPNYPDVTQSAQMPDVVQQPMLHAAPALNATHQATNLSSQQQPPSVYYQQADDSAFTYYDAQSRRQRW